MRRGIRSTILLSLLSLLYTTSLPPRAAGSFVPIPSSTPRRITMTTTTTTTATTRKVVELTPTSPHERIAAAATATAPPTRYRDVHHYHRPSRRAKTLLLASKDGDDDDAIGGSMTIGGIINPPYAIAYVLFVAFAFWRSYSEVPGSSLDVLRKFLDNPMNPIGINELFVTIFNLLGLYAAPFACLLVPSSSRRRDDRGMLLPATPFVLGSVFGGYGILGLYASLRRKPDDAMTLSKSDLGWFASNVLENRGFNFIVLLAFVSAYVTSGLVDALIANPLELVDGYRDLFDSTAIVSASSLDFAILTIVAASYVPEDLRRRGYDNDEDGGGGGGCGLSPELIAASTILFPGLGIALYCALRPSLDEE
ncbi:hypothetical protein ACHAXA_005971 [Cyclostephanos tholiformis]|uniref:Uncharacterized protein n=1 Tax=Cyclostephanos tholiformis TaxID=382380 RepID=A0ABD3SEH7_9STRA